MKKVFQLSKECLDVAVEEVLTLASKKSYNQAENLLILDADFDFQRLAYTKAVYSLLFACKKSQLKAKMQSYAWQKIYRKDFCIRAFNGNLDERELGSIVWETLKKPKVNLTNPKTEIHIFIIKNNAFVCLLKEKIKNSFEQRKAHKRASLHPSSLHPKLARAMVNLTGIKKGILTDPFCGTGGILMEAGLMGFKVKGYDIDERMLKGAEKNLKSLKIKDYTLKKADSTKLKAPMKYVAADLPYGRNTKTTAGLYSKFFPMLKKSKAAVIGIPSFIKHKPLLKKAGLKIKKEFTYYLHKSLSKRIIVL